MKLTTFVLIVAVLPAGAALAQTQVPNTFQAGQPARASEVNANFSAVVTAVNQNAVSIDSNSQSITGVSQDVTANTQSLQSVSQAVAALTPPPGFEFAGFSTSTVNGGVGIFGMNAACQTTFGANSRMATSVEVLYGTVQPSMTAATAWVKPVVISIIPRGIDNLEETMFDASGVGTVRGSLSCGGWSMTQSGLYGLALNASGGFLEQTCAMQAAVACSVRQ